MSKSKKPKYSEKQCITWLDSDGERHRSRFFKANSLRVIDRELESKQLNLSCYDVEVMSKSHWVRKFGEVDFPRIQPQQKIDMTMIAPTYEMRLWKQKNRNHYYNSIY